jgi:hypothetical protein
MTRKQRQPEFDLPKVILDALTAYVGPRAMARLSTNQRLELARIAYETGGAFGKVLNTAAPTSAG